MIKGLIALSFGTLSFGTAEFVVMGLLPYIAQDFNVSHAMAGNTIAAYSFGVCTGVIYLISTRKLNLKTSILIVICVHFLALIATAFAPTFELLLAARFFSGMPHGCYIGLGAIIAARLAKNGNGSSAMAILLAGQTLANVFCVPLGTTLAHAFSWRMIFYIFVLWSMFVFISVWRFLPDPGKMEDKGFKNQFAFLKYKAPYLVGAAMLLGNGGIFCMHTYVSPVLTDFVGIPLPAVSTILIAMGIAMAIANLVAGKFSDIYTPGRVSCFLLFTTIATLLGSFFWGNNAWIGIPLLIYSSGMLFGLSTPLQVAILRTAPGGELIAMAIGQIGFNLGNSLGAFVGGIPLDMGMSPSYCILVGAIITALGTLTMYIYIRQDEYRYDKTRKQRLIEEAHNQALQQLQNQSSTDASAVDNKELSNTAADTNNTAYTKAIVDTNSAADTNAVVNTNVAAKISHALDANKVAVATSTTNESNATFSTITEANETPATAAASVKA